MDIEDLRGHGHGVRPRRGTRSVVIQELKEIGVNLALDDFGTGHCSLAYLAALPVDVLKIDQTFIAKLSAKPGSRAAVAAIIGLAHNLGLRVVAEGVETAAQNDEVTPASPIPVREPGKPGPGNDLLVS